MSRNKAILRTPIVGFLSASLDEPYQYSVWCGAQEEARRFGVPLVFFGGKRVGSPVGHEALDNIAFDLAKQSSLSGLIIMANAIGTYLTRNELSDFLNDLSSPPVVSVGVAFSGIPSVRVRSSGGMRIIVEHLAVVHSRRRFLFLAGPVGHAESEAREKEFLQSIAKISPSLPVPVIITANFAADEAKTAVEHFLASGGKTDAVVAANDLMAFGALQALFEAGYDVPRDVSVTGFDDIENCRYSIPPLTTIRQPTHELGCEAFQRIAQAIALDEKSSLLSLSASQPEISFVIRDSCGCQKPAVRENSSASAGDDTEILAELSRAVNRELAFARNPALLPFPLGLDRSSRERAALIVSEGEIRYQSNLRAAADRRIGILRDLNSSLVSSFDITDILRVLARGTRDLGIKACWLALFDSSEGTPVWARLLLAATDEQVRILAPYGLRFRTIDLLPGGLPEPWGSYICEPLCFGVERLGYIIFTGDPVERSVFETLRDQVSGAIKSAQLMTAERNREKQLALEVRTRTLELSAANARLVEEIDGRRTLEKELLKISNDIMGSIGRDIHDHLCQDIAGIGLRAALLEGVLKRSSDLSVRATALDAQEIVHSAGKAAELAKSIARGLYPAELEAKGIVDAVLNLVVSARKRCPAAIEFEVTNGFELYDSEKALQLYRIIQEALGNAVSHSKAKNIGVGLYMDLESVAIEVRDDGIGLGDSVANGSGMGLRIMKYRASVIGGELRIRSHNEGTAISCRIAKTPRKKAT